MPKPTISFSKYIAQLSSIPPMLSNKMELSPQQHDLPKEPEQEKDITPYHTINRQSTEPMDSTNINPSATNQQISQYNQGIEQGIALQQIQTALKMLGKGMGPQLICDITEIPIEHLQKMQQELLHPR